MDTVLIILQFCIIFALVAVILLQRNGGDGLAGLAGGGHGLVSGKTAANAFSRFTMILACAFMLNSLLLAKLHLRDTNKAHELIQSLETIEKPKEAAPIAVPHAE